MNEAKFQIAWLRMNCLSLVERSCNPHSFPATLHDQFASYEEHSKNDSVVSG